MLGLAFLPWCDHVRALLSALSKNGTGGVRAGGSGVCTLFSMMFMASSRRMISNVSYVQGIVSVMNEYGDEKVALLEDGSKAVGSTGLSRQVFWFGVAAASCYSLTYFWRFAIFVLPMNVLEQNVCTIFGSSVDLQAAFSLTLTIGFGIAKVPAITVMSSEFFFAHRFKFLLSLLWVSMLLMAIGTSAFYHILAAQVCIYYLLSTPAN